MPVFATGSINSGQPQQEPQHVAWKSQRRRRSTDAFASEGSKLVQWLRFVLVHAPKPQASGRIRAPA